MTRTRVRTVSIATRHDQSSLSKGQKAFNALIKQIEKGRARLAAWDMVIPPYARKYASELIPLVDDLTDLQVEMVHGLDRASNQKGLTRTERRMLADLIAELAGDLVAGRDDAELKAIYNRHSRSDYDREEAASMQGMKSMLEGVFGLELGDDLDTASPEDMLERAKAQMHERQAHYDAERQARVERMAKRKRSAKQLAKEAQQQAEEQQAGQSIREIYRKLVSVLHPDRETDAKERARKTALMQRANQAYDRKNLLQLLELQLELEHIDQAAIDNIGEQRLKHYNKILKEQLVELEQETLRVEGSFRAQFDIDPFAVVSPSTVLRNLASEIIGVEQSIRDMKEDLLAIEDVRKVKAWLKHLRHRAPMDDLDDLPF